MLLEMLTGRPVFTGETMSHVLAAVLTKDPDWAAAAPARRASWDRGERREQVEELEHEADALPPESRQLVVSQRTERRAFEAHLAR